MPRLWLLTDTRIADAALMAALTRLPRGAGVIFRHRDLDPGQRRQLFEAVRTITRRRGLMLILAGSPRLARAWGADGFHGRRGRAGPGQWHSAPVHDRKEMATAERAGADLLLVSPLFATRSHPDGHGLGPLRFAMLARQARTPVIALGGMTAARWLRIAAMGAHGWAAIDALSR